MTIRLKLSLLLIILFVTSIGNNVFTFVLEKHGEEKLDWVIHTNDVIITSERFLSAMKDTETGQRGFLLTENPTYLEPYHNGLLSAQEHLAKLNELVTDNPDQLSRLEKIKQLMDKKFIELKLTIEMMQDNKMQLSHTIIDTIKENTGKLHMDELRRELVRFKHAEELLLEQRKGDFKESRVFVTTVVGIEILFFTFLAVSTGLFIRNKLFAPMQKLISGTEKMEKGERQSIIDILPNDEMGYLLSRFYKMSEKVYDEKSSLTYKATHDELTGLKNRACVEAEINNSISALMDNGLKSAVLFIDLNKFKNLNDTLGHAAGDAILQETALRLKKSIRSGDEVFRLGGDEFVVLLKNINNPTNVEIIAQNILRNFEEPALYQNQNIDIALSIGITLIPDDSINTKDILKFADIAMYQAKANEEKQYHFFEK